MVYFSDLEPKPANADSRQLESLWEFRQELRRRGICRTFNSRNEFQKLFEDHLALALNAFEPQPETPKSASRSGYDDPPKSGYYPHTRISEIDCNFFVGPDAFHRVATLLDVWRSEMTSWKHARVEVRLNDQWGIDRLRLRELSRGNVPTDLVIDSDEAFLVKGIIFRLGNPRLMNNVDLRFQTLEFKWQGLLSQCQTWEAIIKLLDLGVIKHFVQA